MREAPADRRSLFETVLRPRILTQAILIGAIAGALAGIISLMLPKSYLATARILPSPESAPIRGAELLQMTGLATSLGAAIGGENPVLTYPEVLTSTPILNAVLVRTFPAGSSTTVLDRVEVNGKSERERLYKGRKALREMIGISSNVRTGIIDVGVIAGDSVLAAYLANALVEELQRFNVTSRSSTARAAREFAEHRLRQSRIELAAAERELALFRESNVRFANSPKLQMDQGRLEREVDSKADVFKLLTREFEMSRLQESRDTPTFTVLEPATPPFRKYRPRTILNAVAAAGGSAIAWLVFVWVGDLRRNQRVGVRP